MCACFGTGTRFVAGNRGQVCFFVCTLLLSYISLGGIGKMANKWVYLFTEGNANMRELLGGKGAESMDLN